MARKKNEVTVIEASEMPAAVAARFMAAHNDTVTQYDRAVALAHGLGYAGAMTVDALEMEIRFYQRRSVEAILEVGKRLLVLRELTVHGNSSQIGTNFDKRVEELGFSRTTAYRFMQAAAKTSKCANLAHLSQEVKSASAFLELVTHDDDADLETLAESDEIECLSAAQVRERLRELKKEREAEQKVMDAKQKKIDKLEVDLQLAKTGKRPPDVARVELSAKLAAAAQEAGEVIQNQLRTGIERLLAHGTEHGGNDGKTGGRALAAGCVMQIQQALNEVRDEFELPKFQDYVPDWFAATAGDASRANLAAPPVAGDVNLFDMAEEVDPKTFNA